MSQRDRENSTDAAPEMSRFDAALKRALKRHGVRPDRFCRKDDVVAQRVLEEYGAMFVASTRVRVPPVCVFSSEEEVLQFQESVAVQAEAFGETMLELQPAALQALIDARAEARMEGLDVSPRGGAEAGRRSFEDSVRLWRSRVVPALDHWQQEGRLTEAAAARLASLALPRQVAEVLELEKQGILFSTDFSKTILQSVAAPGASQHLALLAFDMAEFRDERVRRTLMRHGWFQTVRNDLPHFTFLGLRETDLETHGLARHTEADGQVFWVPDVVRKGSDMLDI